MRHANRPLLVLRRAAVTAALCFASGLLGCGGSEDTGPDPEDVDDGPPRIPNERPAPAATSLDCPDGTTLTYENFGRGFLLNHCTMCHASTRAGDDRSGAPEGVDFDTHQGLLVWRAAALSLAVPPGPTSTARMPPRGGATSTETTLLREWLSCGAPAKSK